MNFFNSLGDFFKHAAHLIFLGARVAEKYEPAAVGVAEAAGLGHFLSKPLEAQGLVTSIVGDVLDLVHGSKPGDAVTLSADAVRKVRQLIALVEAHPEAPK